MKTFTKQVFFISLCIITTLVCFAKPETINRSEVPDTYKWNFTDIYPDWQAWEKDITLLDKKSKQFESIKGTISQSPENLLQAYILHDEMRILHSKINNYLLLQLAVNIPVNDTNDKLLQLRMNTENLIQSTAWFDPEILSISETVIDRWLTTHKKLAPYKMNIAHLFHSHEHSLSEDNELLLSNFLPLSEIVSSLYRTLVDDMAYTTITLSTGEKKGIRISSIHEILCNEKFTQEDRKLAEAELNKTFKKHINTLAAIYAASCERDWAFAHARNYSSCLEAELFNDIIPTSVFENLIQTARAHTSVVQRYLSLKQKYIMKRKNLTKFRSYDRFLNLIDFTKEYPYEIGKKTVFNAVAPLGVEYQSYMRRAFDNRWIDVYYNVGKNPSCFTQMTYGNHPFANLCYQDQLENVFNLAHELGHVMNYVYSGKAQPFATFNLSTLTAEVISQLNEHLVVYYLLENASDHTERAAYLDKALSNIFDSFWQLIFHSDFEYQTHQLAEQGKLITADSLISIEKELNKIYFGDTIDYDAHYRGIEWSKEQNYFIKRPFLAFQYVVGFAASLQLYTDLKTGSSSQRETARKRYINLLKSGSSDYPLELLRKAGVDMTRKDAFMVVIAEMDRLVTLLEEELKYL